MHRVYWALSRLNMDLTDQHAVEFTHRHHNPLLVKLANEDIGNRTGTSKKGGESPRLNRWSGLSGSTVGPLVGPCKQLRRPRALTGSFGMYMHITLTEIRSCVSTPTWLVNGTETEPPLNWGILMTVI
jgi:hypothetical protein